MCGYLGVVSLNGINHKDLINANTHIICRGPDNKKISNFISNNNVHDYIFNRLSIVDLSRKADQPMTTLDGRYLIMFNGEIYNHFDLKKYLEKKGVQFFTHHSDTEVVLNGLAFEGKKFINKLRGQFSIYFFDKKKNFAYLVRDRLGQKPVYYKLKKDSFVFGSNLRSINKISPDTININRLDEFIVNSVITSPNTIFENIYKLPPATILTIDFSNSKITTKSEIYWRLEENLDDFDFEYKNFIDLFEDSVTIRANADVPVANFLSGGLDSTAIVKAMSKEFKNVNTFTVNLYGENLNESYWAEKVSKKYNTIHTTIDVDSSLDIDDVDEIIELLDEPYGDPSVIPTYLISKEISKKYKVALSGDGGDELLGGYFRIKDSLRKKSIYRSKIAELYKYYPGFLGTGNILLKNSLNSEIVFLSYLQDQKLLETLKPSSKKDVESLNFTNINDNYKKLLLADYKFYLSEMMMLKIDKASMSNSLEVRSPFVDHLLIEYIFKHKTQFDEKNTKKIIKDYLIEDFDSDFLNRKKQGFEFDIKNFIFDNLAYFMREISEGEITNFYQIKKIKLLNLNKSRINAIRIWKIYILNSYLKSL